MINCKDPIERRIYVNDWMFLESCKQFIDTSLVSNVQDASKMEIVVQPPDHEMEMGKVLGLGVVLQMLESPAAHLQSRWSGDF